MLPSVLEPYTVEAFAGLHAADHHLGVGCPRGDHLAEIELNVVRRIDLMVESVGEAKSCFIEAELFAVEIRRNVGGGIAIRGDGDAVHRIGF